MHLLDERLGDADGLDEDVAADPSRVNAGSTASSCGRPEALATSQGVWPSPGVSASTRSCAADA
jgi:hypothetical protein